jgi:hypothetical protein
VREAQFANNVRFQLGLGGAKGVLKSPLVLIERGVGEFHARVCSYVVAGKHCGLPVEHEFSLEVGQAGE